MLRPVVRSVALGHGDGDVPALSYPIVCTFLGLVLGWVPYFLHGPIAEKFDVFYIGGSFAVWAWYLTRMSIGLLVGITIRPRIWWIRGPLVGGLTLLPLGFISLAVPTCGPTCMAINMASGAGIGFAVGALAYLFTGRSHAEP